MGAGLRIGKGVVMVLQIKATGLGHSVQLVVGQAMPKMAARSPTGA